MNDTENIYDAARAMRAVLDLHRPFEAEPGRVVCLQCVVGNEIATYPCPTVKALRDGARLTAASTARGYTA